MDPTKNTPPKIKQPLQQSTDQNSAQNATTPEENNPPLIEENLNTWEMMTTLGLEDRDLQELKEQNEANVQRTKDFKTALGAALSPGTTDAKLENLRNFCFCGEGIERFNDMELTEIYNKLFELGGYHEMDVLMSQAPSDAFKQRYTNREMHARALMLKTPPELEIANHLITTIINDIILGKGPLQDTDQICLGEAYGIRAEILSAQNASPEKIAKAYENAFVHGKKPDHGIQAAQYLKILGQKNRAQKLIDTSYLAAIRDGAMDAKRPEATRAALTCIALGLTTPKDEKAQKILALRYLNSASAENLQSLKNELGAIGTPEAQGILKLLSTAPSDLKSSGNESFDHAVDKSFSYRGLKTASIGGNLIYGGQLPSHAISRDDLVNFQTVLKEPVGNLFLDAPENVRDQLEEASIEHGFDLSQDSLNDIEDPKIFNQVLDIFIRFQMRTDALELEDLHSTGHQEFDRTVVNSQKLAGFETKESKQSALDWTSVSSSFAMRLGDCRHHAQAKQLMFDLWQSNKVNHLIEDALNEDATVTEESINKAESIMSVELRTLDVTLRAPVQMKEKYDAIYHLDSSGNKVHVEDDNVVDMEDHTLNILVDHENESVECADSFYQNTFNLKEGSLDTNNFDPQQGWTFCSVDAIDKDGNFKQVEVTGIPTVYAGTRHSNQTTIDQQYFVGRPVRVDLIDSIKGRGTIDATLHSIESSQI